mgnify:CR=1 FL=1
MARMSKPPMPNLEERPAPSVGVAVSQPYVDPSLAQLALSLAVTLHSGRADSANSVVHSAKRFLQFLDKGE